MKRKVIRLANSTLVVSLPHQWASAQGISKGDEVDMEIAGEKLVVSTEAKGSQDRSINTSVGLDDLVFVRSYLGALYRSGCSEIHLRYDNPKLIRTIQQAVTHLIGFEIMEQKSGYCLIRNVIGESDQDIERILSKLINLVRVMHTMLCEDITTAHHFRLDEMDQCRYSAWKFRDFGHRVLLSKESLTNTLAPRFLIVWILEKISRDYYYLYKHACHDTSLKNAIPILDDISQYFGSIVQHWHTDRFESWEGIFPRRERIRNAIRSAETSANPVFWATLAALNQKLHDMTSSILMSQSLKIEPQI